MFQKISGTENVRDKRGGGYHDFLSKLFCLTVPKNFVGEPFSVSSISGSKNFMLQRVMSRFSVENFLSHSTETFRRGTLFCCVSENFWWRKSKKFMDKRGGGVSRFPSKNFRLTVPKNAVGKPFGVSLIPGIEKFYASEGYVTIFCRIFLSHSAEKFRRGTLLCCVSENFQWPKSLWITGGEYKDFPSKIFCLTVPKIFVGTP